MTTVLESEQEQFVKDLALSELERLNVNVSEFITKHTKDMYDKAKEQQDKKLLQEDRDVKDK